MLTDFMQCTEVHFHQHGNDHHPDQQTDRQVDARNFDCAYCLESIREELSECDTDNNASENPQAQGTFEETHRLVVC